MNRKQRFLNIAKKMSYKSTHHSHKLGCVIANGNKILGAGFNNIKSHVKSPHPFKSIHAEFMAVMCAGYDVGGATAYVFRQQKNGQWAAAKPCASCWAFLKKCGIKEIVYSYEGAFKEEKVG